jgi:hypothetical protein
MSEDPPAVPSPTKRLGRIVFTTFLLSFIASRVLVILIMAKTVPDLFLHMGGTHVHHLNYGIFLLSFAGAVLLFCQLDEPGKQKMAYVYGFGMALTFDEFGMWLHLGGSYWQRGSFDAVIVVLSLFGVIAFAPRWDRFRSRHWVTAVVTLLTVAGFYWLLFWSMNRFGHRYAPRFHQLEEAGPQ